MEFTFSGAEFTNARDITANNLTNIYNITGNLVLPPASAPPPSNIPALQGEHG
jgi:hypothetical protein